MRASGGGKMTVRNEPVVFIIDTLPVRSLGFISILNRLNHLGDPTKAPVTLHTSDEAQPGTDADAKYQMLIYIAGGASDADRDNLERIKALRALAPDVPLMIISDSESRKEILSAVRVGAQGSFYIGVNPELALQAFSFMLKGGSYFPSAMRPKQTDPAQMRPAIDCIPTPLLRHGWGQRRCKRFGRRSEKSQSNSEAEGGPRTPAPGRDEQGNCAPAGDEGRYRQSSCPADHAQVRRDEPHADRSCLRERPAQPKGGDTS
jgi:DNA-binding NarL/FixJ family response regulator